MHRPYLFISLILSSGLTLISCMPYGGDAVAIQGNVDVFFNQNNHLCFQPQMKNVVHLDKKISNLSLKSIRYDLEEIDRVEKKHIETAKEKIQNATGDEKIAALNDYLNLEDTKLIWYAEINDRDEVFYEVDPLCIDEYNPNYIQQKYAYLTKGSNYYVYMRGYTKRNRHYVFFSKSFNYNDDLPVKNLR